MVDHERQDNALDEQLMEQVENEMLQPINRQNEDNTNIDQQGAIQELVEELNASASEDFDDEEPPAEEDYSP